MFALVASLVILLATIVIAAISIALLRDPPGAQTDDSNATNGRVRRVRGPCGQVREYYASDIPPDAESAVETDGGGVDAGERMAMFPGLITLRHFLARTISALRPIATQIGLPVPAASTQSRKGHVVSLAGTAAEQWEDAARRLGIEYPLDDRALVQRAVETVQTAWMRMAGDEPRMTPMAQRIAITGLLSDDASRRELAASPTPSRDDRLVERAMTLLTRQVLAAPGRGNRTHREPPPRARRA